MKTHEHALISLVYGAAIAFAAGKGLSDAGIYVAALVGGELIDIIDHPLYQLVFARKDQVVADVRAKFQKGGFRAGVQALGEHEDQRAFNKLRLHNVFSLTLFALTAIITSLFSPGPVYSFVLLGAFLLHMLTDIYGDFKLLGHFDNWLWILPHRAITWLGERGPALVWMTLLWWVDILVAFVVVSFRAYWQFFSQSPTFLRAGLSEEAKIFNAGELWIAYGPLLVLLIYFSMIFVLVIAGAHKINLETPAERRGNRNRFSTGSLMAIRNILSGKTSGSQNRLEQIVLAMQADIAVWILIVTALIAGLLTLETWLHFDLTLILLTPMVCALIFGTLVHTSLGEFGGVQGVLLATFINLIFVDPGLKWPIYYGYLLFFAALGAWLLGLLGGILLAGHKKMSLIAFVIRIETKDGQENGKGLHHIVDVAHHGLDVGYRQAHRILKGEDKQVLDVKEPKVDFLVAPHSGGPAIFGEHYHLKIKDQTVPILQNIAFVLCNNRLTSHNPHLGKFGLMPTLPRGRILIKNPQNADLVWKDGCYFWDSAKQDLSFPSCENVQGWLGQGRHLGLIKTWGELFDDLLTGKWTFTTDLYLFPTPEQPCSMTICGISGTTTSTKEFATIETELYVSETMKCIQEIARHIPDIKITESQSARLVFPHNAFDDLRTSPEIFRSAVFPAYINDCLSKESAGLIARALKLIPGGEKIFEATKDWEWGRRFVVLAGEIIGSILFSQLEKVIEQLLTNKV